MINQYLSQYIKICALIVKYRQTENLLILTQYSISRLRIMIEYRASDTDNIVT